MRWFRLDRWYVLVCIRKWYIVPYLVFLPFFCPWKNHERNNHESPVLELLFTPVDNSLLPISWTCYAAAWPWASFPSPLPHFSSCSTKGKALLRSPTSGKPSDRTVLITCRSCHNLHVSLSIILAYWHVCIFHKTLDYQRQESFFKNILSSQLSSTWAICLCVRMNSHPKASPPHRFSVLFIKLQRPCISYWHLCFQSCAQ